MLPLNDRIIDALLKTEVPNISRLIDFMKGDYGFFWVNSNGHDHWTNGTAQHSWRVCQYMLYLWQHPEEIPCNRCASGKGSQGTDPLFPTEDVRKLTEKEIILTGLLHDLGKMIKAEGHYPHGHEIRSKMLLEEKLGADISSQFTQVAGAIYFHHGSSKKGGPLEQYRNSTLTRLLKKCDSMASGTTWNSTRFKEHRTQHLGEPDHSGYLRSVALDRTSQCLDYHLFLDYDYILHEIHGFNRNSIVWNYHSDLIATLDPCNFSSMKDADNITEMHHHVERGEHCTLVIGMDTTIPKSATTRLYSNNQQMQDLLICGNILNSLYFRDSRVVTEHKNHYGFTMREDIKENFSHLSFQKGIFLPSVTFFRDGADEGFRMVSPWKSDVLLVPNLNGAKLIVG